MEVKERIDAEGRVVRGLDVADLRLQIEVLKSEKVEAVTVCLMNAYVNGAHEEAVREVLKEEMPNIPVSVRTSLSTMYVDPTIYLRATTTHSSFLPPFLPPLPSSPLRSFPRCTSTNAPSPPLPTATSAPPSAPT